MMLSQKKKRYLPCDLSFEVYDDITIALELATKNAYNATITSTYNKLIVSQEYVLQILLPQCLKRKGIAHVTPFGADLVHHDRKDLKTTTMYSGSCHINLEKINSLVGLEAKGKTLHEVLLSIIEHLYKKYKGKSLQYFDKDLHCPKPPFISFEAYEHFLTTLYPKVSSLPQKEMTQSKIASILNISKDNEAYRSLAYAVPVLRRWRKSATVKR